VVGNFRAAAAEIELDPPPEREALLTMTAGFEADRVRGRSLPDGRVDELIAEAMLDRAAEAGTALAAGVLDRQAPSAPNAYSTEGGAYLSPCAHPE
jgi:hypothetical protein